jgi:integrase
MAQRGYVFKKGSSWFLKYRENSIVNGVAVRKQKCVWLAEVSDKYKTAGDLDDLVAEKMGEVRQAAKCPLAGTAFVEYVEGTYLPHCARMVALQPKPKMAVSTYHGYQTYWTLYIKPHVARLALRDFTISIVSKLLAEIARMHELNAGTITKVCSILAGIFSFAITEGDYPARSADDNPAHGARIPDAAPDGEETIAASREEVIGYLAALKDQPLAHTAIAISAYCGTRPSEALGLRWEEWDRTQAHIPVKRVVWHGRVIENTKTENSKRFLVVTNELRTILLTLHKAQGSPTGGFILAARNGKKPTNLDNLSKRAVRKALNRCEVCHESEDAKHKGHTYKRDASLPEWHGWYSLRRFLGTQVRMNSDSSETSAKSLGNTREVADKHYIKNQTVLPEVRRAQIAATEGLSIAS